MIYLFSASEPQALSLLHRCISTSDPALSISTAALNGIHDKQLHHLWPHIS